MRNVFQEKRKKQRTEEKQHKYLELLENKVLNLEKQLEENLKTQKKLIKALEQKSKNMEFQKDIDVDINKNLDESEDFETNYHGETKPTTLEEDYVWLSKPTPPRNKAISILEKEAIKEVAMNRREIIKKKIIDELKKKELSAKELKILFVDEYNYCSKATFYRYLETLRKEQRIDGIKINGKEYLCSISSSETTY